MLWADSSEGEHRPYKPGVTGSNPVPPTKEETKARGRSSARLERRPVTPEVASSNLVGPAIFYVLMDLPFTLKKIVEKIIYPSGLSFILLCLAVLNSFSPYRRVRMRLLLILCLLLFYASSTPFLYTILAKPLEMSCHIPSLSSSQEYKAIVLFPGGIRNQKDLCLYERFDRETLVRFLTAIELKKRFPKVPLIIVGNGYPPGKGASYLAELAKKMGINDVKAIDYPKDTISSVKAICPILQKGKFILVTSAYHLPRSIFLARKAGLHPIGYPANYLSKTKWCFSFRDFWPDPKNFVYLNCVIHEYLGLTYYWLINFLHL